MADSWKKQTKGISKQEKPNDVERVDNIESLSRFPNWPHKKCSKDPVVAIVNVPSVRSSFNSISKSDQNPSRYSFRFWASATLGFLSGILLDRISSNSSNTSPEFIGDLSLVHGTYIPGDTRVSKPSCTHGPLWVECIRESGVVLGWMDPGGLRGWFCGARIQCRGGGFLCYVCA